MLFIEINNIYDHLDPLFLPIFVPPHSCCMNLMPHDNHIYVYVHVDVLHGRKVAFYANLGCTLAFTY
jgi:hypothetical protein